MGDFTVCSLKVTLGPVRLLVNICRLTQTRTSGQLSPMMWQALLVRSSKTGVARVTLGEGHFEDQK